MFYYNGVVSSNQGLSFIFIFLYILNNLFASSIFLFNWNLQWSILYHIFWLDNGNVGSKI
jgi:hypothetical protein